uniref:Inner-membrane translocator n=1 Tax=Chlorobium phaeobacteroides (strain BS1) TaxID=331678 RepID=B3ENC6_CHLPB
MAEIYIILGLAMNLLAGYSGLLSLSQAAFYGIGAYTTTVLLVYFGYSFPAVLAMSVIINVIACIPVIVFSIRFRDLFFVLATLAWQVIVFTVLYNWISVTNGPYGIGGIPKPVVFGYAFESLPHFSFLAGVVCVFVLLFFYGLHQSPLSRYFQGVRDDQLAMLSFGKKPGYYKAIAVSISSGASAIAGALFASYYSYIDPTSFTLNESILIISIVLIGGLGTMRGSVAGALFYVLLPEVLRFVNVPDAVASNLRMMIYALILILMVLFRPYGFFGNYRFE